MLGDSGYVESFPLDFLFLLSELYRNGMDVKEGKVFERTNPVFRMLKWPGNIDALVTLDIAFDYQIREQEVEGESVQILCIVPLKYNKAGKLKESKLNEWIAKQRTAKWEKISIKKE